MRFPIWTAPGDPTPPHPHSRLPPSLLRLSWQLMPGSPRGGANLAPPTITSFPLPPCPSLLCVSCAPDRDGCEEGDQGEVRGWGIARTPATQKGRGTSGGEGASRGPVSPLLRRGFAGSPVALGEGGRSGWWGAEETG